MKIMLKIRAALHWLQRLLCRSRAQDAEAISTPAKRRRLKKDGWDAEQSGAHYYLGTLLDDLDGVFRHLPKMRKSDPDAYAIYARLGATIVPEGSGAWSFPEPHIMGALPAFGCVYLGRDSLHSGSDKKSKFPVRFAYLMKVKRPHYVQPVKGTIYRVGSTVDLLDGKNAVYVGFHVAVSPDASEITVLKEKVESVYSPRSGAFVRIEWRFPDNLLDCASRNDMTPENLATDLFSFVVNMAYARESGLTVTASKGKQSAVFAIDMLRTPYFFKDREKVVNENGTTKRIFHIVAGHTRTLAGGRKKFIKPHFRGLRNFEWQGYSVSIDMVGRTAQGLSSFGVGAVDLDHAEVGVEHLTASQVSKKIKARVA